MPSDSDLPIIDVDGVSVDYRVRRSIERRLPLVKRTMTTRRSEWIPALRDVSMQVDRGSVVGIIGRNGAGKSTLLRAISGLMPLTAGRITLRGEISAFLTRGVGFNKQLTARENIHLGGLAAGMTPAQVAERFDEIVDFCELPGRLDHPVKTYSTGMASRLAFSVAVHMDPEVLLVDEALGAGDAAFKEKCRQKMLDLCGDGRTVLVVTHGVSSVRDLTSRCVWLEEGRVKEQGATEDVVNAYLRALRLEDRPDWDDDWDD